MRKDDGFTPEYRSELLVSSADNVGTMPTLWALPGLLPCHHVSAVVGTTGVGLTQLAIQICAHLAPKPTPHLLPDLRSSVSHSDVSDLQSQISDPIPLSPPLPISRSCDSSPCPRVSASPCPSEPADVDPSPILPAVLLIAGREAAETLRARLTAAGADLRRILILTEVTDTDTVRGDQIKRPLKVSDYKLIGDVLREHKSIRLVLIDNAEDLFFDTNRIKKSRLLRQLACFRALAESREVNVTLLANIPRLENDPFRSTMLSTLREVCRTVHLLAPDLPQPASGNPESRISDVSAFRSSLSALPTRLLFPIKNTLLPNTPTLRLNLFPSGEACPNPSSIFTLPSSIFAPALTYPHYLKLLHTSPSTRGPKPEKLTLACQVLTEILRSGPLPVGHEDRPTKGTLMKLTKEANLKWRTVERAADTLNIKAFRIGNKWHWQLPTTIPTLPQPTDAPSQVPSTKDGSTDLAEVQAPDDETRRPCPQNEAQTPQQPEDTERRATPENKPVITNSPFDLMPCRTSKHPDASLVGPTPGDAQSQDPIRAVA